MKVPYRWIGELVDIKGEDPKALGRTLTLIGLEAEEGQALSRTFEGVIAAEVLRAVPEGPGMLLTLFDGREENTVYSTAPGIAAGQVVAYAPPGATLGSQPVEVKSFTRDDGSPLTSEGAVCSAQELGIGRESRDLLELPGVAPGTDLAELLFVDEPIAVEYPSNRGDVLSLLGIGRELAVHFGTEPPRFDTLPPTEVVWGSRPESVSQGGISIAIHELEYCPRYAARVFTDVRVDDSPPELLRRLISLGLKPINNIVDITNIVLMELGQPLHPFDLDTLHGQAVIVRRAKRGESMETLDSIRRELNDHDLLITDPDGPIAMAGVMGGKQSEVSWGTTRVLLESARFNRVAVRRTARRHNLRTDASLRFERGIDPALVEMALDRVAWYIDRYQLGQVEPVTLSAGHPNPASQTLAADLALVGRVLGAEIPPAQAEGILQRLGFQVADAGGTKRVVTVPTWRADVQIGEDLAEEVARHFGYNNIPTALPPAPMKGMVEPPGIRFRHDLKATLAGMGFRELMTFPLGADKLMSLVNPLKPEAQSIHIENALSSDQSTLAPSLLPGFLAALRQNHRNRNRLERAMEVNKVYWRDTAGEHREAEELALMVAVDPGPRAEEQAFLALKGIIERLFADHHIAHAFLPDDHAIPPFAEGMAAHYRLGGERTAADHRQHVQAGILGVVDPALVEAWDLPLVVAFAHFDWEAVVEAALAGKAAIRFTPLPRFPVVRRDLALVTPETLRYGDLKATIEAHGGPYLVEVGLFDVFRGKQVPAGHKSLAFNLAFQNPEATLTDEEVSAALVRILEAAQQTHGATLRT
ncbi:MAG TPA: phenylalanine--tRNA ligase subunit beta [bacterium]|nr:phenylalanine--tRNA ligase subunit beta [bacterium]